MARLVLTDTSPLIGLARVGGLSWLRDLFGTVELTPSVHLELVHGGEPETGIAAALAGGWLVARESDPGGPARPPHLGPGEWTTLLAAQAHGRSSLVLMDDRLARREAELLGVRVAGTAAVVGMAAERRLIPSARDVFARLLRADFRISPAVIRAVLERCEPP